MTDDSGDDDITYEVEAVLDSRRTAKGTQYLIKWKGYDEEQNTWEPASNVSTDLIRDFKAGQKSAAAKGAAKEVVAAAPAGEEEEDDDEENEDGDGEDDGDDGSEYAPPGDKALATPAARAKPEAAAAQSGARTQKRAREASALEEGLPAELTEANVRPILESLGVDALKTVISELTPRGSYMFNRLKAGTKSAMVADLLVGLRAIMAGKRTRRDYSDRPLQVCVYDYDLHTKAVRLACYRKALENARSSAVAKRLKPPPSAVSKALAPRLSVLDKAQLIELVTGLVDEGSLTASAVEAHLPTADLGPTLKECERLVRKIGSSLPRSRYGSSTDHFGYKRCASAAQAAKKALVDGGAALKKAKQWDIAATYAHRALPIADSMVEFDRPEDNGARNAAIKYLTELKAESERHGGVAASE